MIINGTYNPLNDCAWYLKKIYNTKVELSGEYPQLCKDNQPFFYQKVLDSAIKSEMGEEIYKHVNFDEKPFVARSGLPSEILDRILNKYYKFTIPHVLHYVWVTQTKNPKEPIVLSPPVKEHITSNKGLLGYEVNLWTNCVECIPETVSFFKKIQGKVLDFKDIPLTNIERNLIYTLINKSEESEYRIANLMLVLTSDIVRANILKHFGGLYIDFDIKILKDISPLLDSSDFWSGGSNNLMASKKNHPILNDYLIDFSVENSAVLSFFQERLIPYINGVRVFEVDNIKEDECASGRFFNVFYNYRLDRALIDLTGPIRVLYSYLLFNNQKNNVDVYYSDLVYGHNYPKNYLDVDIGSNPHMAYVYIGNVSTISSFSTWWTFFNEEVQYKATSEIPISFRDLIISPTDGVEVCPTRQVVMVGIHENKHVGIDHSEL